MNGTGCSCPPERPPTSSTSSNAGLNAVLRQPDIAARLKQLNVESRENTPEEFRAFVAAEMEKWGRVVREANVRLG
jgi:tripartite-type tricarboxylate transporter receptor subunit TctC